MQQLFFLCPLKCAQRVIFYVCLFVYKFGECLGPKSTHSQVFLETQD